MNNNNKTGENLVKLLEKFNGYLGDGVYVSFDGYAVWLKANNPDHPTDKICLEPAVFRALLAWRETVDRDMAKINDDLKGGTGAD